MSTQIQFRRGSSSQSDSFTGALGEITVDTTNRTLRVHDGIALGGVSLAKQINVDVAFTQANLAFNSSNNEAGVNATQNTNIQNTLNTASAAFDKANAAVQQAFVTIIANGTSLVADSNTDTLTFNSANGISIFTNASTDTLTINLAPSGVTTGFYGGGANVAIFAVDQFGRITQASNVGISTGTDFAFFMASAAIIK
jgi:hypothetical protein